MKYFMTTGEFAKFCQVTKRVLFYYDELDLLKPAYMNEKGYRYYAMHQFDQMNTIKLFQNLGMSLKDIQELIRKEDFVEKKKVLLEQFDIVNQKIQEFEDRRNNLMFLTKRFSVLQQYGFCQLFEEEIEDEYYYRETKPDGNIWLGYMNYGYQYGVMFERNQFKSFQWTFKRCQQEEANYMKPKGRYYAAFFLLKNEEILTCVPNFLKMLHYEKTYGPLHHEDYCSEIAGFKEQYVIKLSIQIK